MTKNITVHCGITEAVYRSYMNFHVYKRDKSWIRVPIFSLGLVVFAFCNFHTRNNLLGWIFLTLAVYILVSRVLRVFTSINKIAEQFGLSDTPKEMYTLILNPSQIHVENGKESANYEWKQVFHAYRLDNVMYLYLNQQTAFLLTLNQLEGGTEEELWRMITSCVEAEKVTDSRKKG